MQEIEHITLDVNATCRHCSDKSKNSFEGLWGSFFEGIGYRLFDHVSSSKFWFITEPYQHVVPEIVEFDKWLERNGASLFYVSPGYHGRGSVITLIIVPSNLQKFSERVNKVLDTKSRNDAWIDIGAPHTFTFDKSYTRRLIRNYIPPSAHDCMSSAMEYLTWADKGHNARELIAQKIKGEMR